MGNSGENEAQEEVLNAVERWKKTAEKEGYKKCRDCGEEYIKLRNNGLCVKCDPWKRPPPAGKKKEKDIAEIIE